MPILQSDKNILIQESRDKTCQEWVDFFKGKYTKGQIASFCRYNNLLMRKLTPEEKSIIQSQNARKWHINQDYFKTWSSKMAYLLGFWFADGCIYGGKMFDITTHVKDKYILKQFAKELAYEGPIVDYVDRQAARLNFSCVVIYNDLISLGGKEHKSLDISFPSIPHQYLRDFIRGYFDGDGSVWNVQGKRINSSFASGSPNFMYSLWEILKEEALIDGGSYYEPSMSLTFGKSDTIKLGQYMYKNDPELFLLRKREKFNNYI